MPTAVPSAPAPGPPPVADLEPEACYRAVASRDRRFDGVFWTAVGSTGIYCRPSCPARTPARRNVTFHASAAAAQRAGYRACKRCLPDAVPGSPAWDLHADLAGRAMRLIGDGLVDREGVDGLAAALGYSARHVVRVLTAELGAGPLALARARRAQTARALLEGSDLAVTDIAFAAGFASLRQFNATMQEVYAAAPRDLRGRAGPAAPAGALDLRVAVRAPYAAGAMLAFLAEHVVTGIETVTGTVYARSLALPHGPAVLAVDLGRVEGPVEAGVRQVPVTAWLTDLRDTGTLVERVRRLLDADADPVVLDDQLGTDPLLAPLVAATPGLRVAGAVDGPEVALRAVIGQQVSLAGARTVTGRLVERHGEELPAGLAGVVPGLTHLFPTSASLADVDPATLPMPRARGRALTGLAGALATGAVRLDRGWARDDVRAALLALPGIGPWTADYVALRALGHPDVFLPTDVGVRRALVALGSAVDALPRLEAAWRPWRSYALMHLWNTLMPALPGAHPEEDS